MKCLYLLSLLPIGLLADDTFLYRTLQEQPAPVLGKTIYPEGRVPDYYGDIVNITYKQTLNCGACVAAGHIYCYKGNEGQMLKASLSGANSRCCKDAYECRGELASNAWTCTNLFTDPVFAKYACPFVNEDCGDNNTIELSKTGQSYSVDLHVQPGNTCFF